ncbi:ABC-type multidrug transport system fused ATPase/permease subunit [Leeuwenhoekiella aestuarii]|uniref:ABC-type multidrug transport system fused ATPase/permease subunit n=1 Tax=Leeuwenhoekiella aestuarii TaxID=2249426 RepID=A0A4Q0NW04_9FLAO|nr:ABC transporter ATP-binding protein [Leeuwenhoekiella aestuarii]RXG15552.1 ABC-type multidrug transport system fused ATPase/permease subunit [Leeuwenhoekiella aestuarii]RXG17341.1 ABC-type multidrug transport system fused ATPase/permease subunit [Leeuwenhoekiella aestuarii]
MNYFKQILQFAKPYKKYAVLNIVCNILYAIFSTLSFLALIPVIDILFDKEKRVTELPVWEGWGSIKEYAFNSFYYQVSERVADNELSALVLVCGIVVVLFFLKNIFGYLATFFITFLRNGVMQDVRDAIYDKLLELPIAYFSEKRKGDTISRITADVNEVERSFLSILEMVVREPLTIIFTILTMLVISPKLTLFVFIFLPISGMIISRIGKSLKKQSNQAQEENGAFLSIVEETLSSLKIIKGFNGENQFRKKFRDSTSRLNSILNSLVNRQNLASPTSEFLGIFVIVVILWYGGQMVLVEGSLEASQFIAFLGLSYQILTPAKQISKASYSVKKGNAAAERILSVLNTETTIEDLPNAQKAQEFNDAVRIENVSFKYADEYVLTDFNTVVSKGQTVALVGQSGSGKSTIANLVTRFYDVSEGSIKLDGIDIKELSKESVRAQMGLVTQDSILFNDTVRNNILLGKPEASDEEVIDALKIANAWEFVNELPLKLDTNIGDSGNKLSGGQKQRLSIARAVLKNPPIMILDEATSALDTESERLVQKALENMMINRTSIVIAHRLSTIQNADQIIVMQRGKIVEQGKHQELLALNGTYKKLVDMQSFE